MRGLFSGSCISAKPSLFTSARRSGQIRETRYLFRCRKPHILNIPQNKPVRGKPAFFLSGFSEAACLFLNGYAFLRHLLESFGQKTYLSESGFPVKCAVFQPAGKKPICLDGKAFLRVLKCFGII